MVPAGMWCMSECILMFKDAAHLFVLLPVLLLFSVVPNPISLSSPNMIRIIFNLSGYEVMIPGKRVPLMEMTAEMEMTARRRFPHRSETRKLASKRHDTTRNPITTTTFVIYIF